MYVPGWLSTAAVSGLATNVPGARIYVPVFVFEAAIAAAAIPCDDNENAHTFTADI